MVGCGLYFKIILRGSGLNKLKYWIDIVGSSIQLNVSIFIFESDSKMAKLGQ